MALPSHLYRTYMWYKSEEQSLLAWIEETVAARDPHNNKTSKINKQAPNASTDSFITAKNPKSPASIVLAKKNQSVPTARVSVAPLKIYDILPAVELIATSKEVVVIPPHVAQSLRRVADLRIHCLSWFKSNTAADDTETQESNKRHEHAVKVLREVMELLKRKFPTTPSRESLGTDHEATTGHEATTRHEATIRHEQARHISHAYDSLKITDTDTMSLNALAADQLQSEEPPLRLFVDGRSDLKLSPDEVAQEEYNFARFCFWQDVEAIEDFVVLTVT